MRFQCPVCECPSTFEDEEDLKEHMEEKHMELYKELYEGVDEDIEDEDDLVSAKGRNPVMRKHPPSCALAAALFSLLLLHQVKKSLDLPQHIN